MGGLGSMLLLTDYETNINLELIGILFIFSSIGHIISLGRELDREEDMYRQKIKDNNNE